MSTRNARSTRTTPDDQTPDIAQLVAQQVQAAIPNIVTQVVSNLIARRKNDEVIVSIKWKDGKAKKEPRGRKKCFKCGNVGHFRDRYPRMNKRSISTSKRNKKKRVTREYQGCKAQEGAFVIGTEEARQDPHKITGTFPINDHYASVIFDSGADRSFVSLGFRPLTHLTSKRLDKVYSIELADMLGAKSDCIRDHKIVLKLKSKAKSKLLKESQSFINLNLEQQVVSELEIR
ncbi:hypothetical protein OSB04_019585 [Centaurea solstitialis]|uniref:CCHC-type domain-containing protein n=1 Tax=Centaurea solstitialis TaxID=347529 RepID=A0AA38W322_9ASTR|nr:hypothetical protein OSB04_019585 [Centaurea solstitialis]